MSNEQLTVLLGLASTLVSGVIGIILALIRREMGRVRVRLAEVESRRENSRADDANIAMALQLATTIAVTMEPVRKSIDDMVSMASRLMEQNSESLRQFIEKTNEMRTVTARRDLQWTEHRQTGEQYHQELLERLDRQQQQLETITKEVKVRDLPASVRTEIAQLVLLASNISADVKELRGLSALTAAANSPEPGESVETIKSKESKPHES